jgi:hypothetical protein
MKGLHRALLAAATVIAVVSWLASGCAGDSAPEGAAPPSPAPVRPARTLPLPGGAGALPEGHPPLDGAEPTGGDLDVEWNVPETWIEVEPASSMRIAQYRIDGAAGPAECVVFYFGPSQGGGAMANAERWAGQFTQPDGSSSLDRMKVVDIEGARTAAQLVEVSGTYDGGMTMTAEPAKPHPGYMLLGGIVEGPDAPWFFKLTGPEATVRPERERMIGVLRSFRERR